jgi:hypothetical protein
MTPWTYTIDGNDLLFSGLVTAFGGIEDVLDGSDDGATESGQPTAIKVNGQWRDTGLLGCALPIRSTEAATVESPLAFKGPHIRWGTLVKFWPVGQAEPELQLGLPPSAANTFPLVDNGPEYSTGHVADLTKFAAAVFAPQMPLDRLTSDFEMKMNIRVIGGAKYAPAV